MLLNWIPYCQAKDIKNLLVRKELFFWAAILWAGLVFFLCLIQSKNIPSVEIPNLDKFVHAFFHFVFTSLWFLYFRIQLKSNTVFKPLFFSLMFSLFFGITIEILQGIFTTTRKADIYDVLANATGAMLAVYIFYRWYRVSSEKI